MESWQEEASSKKKKSGDLVHRNEGQHAVKKLAQGERGFFLMFNLFFNNQTLSKQPLHIHASNNKNLLTKIQAARGAGKK